MPQVRLHCPHCGFNTLTSVPLLAKRDRSVTCPKCRERFPLHEGLTTTQRPWPKRLKVLLGWLLLPFGYVVLLVMLAMLTALLTVLVPLGLMMWRCGWKPAGQVDEISTGEVLLFTFWAPALLILLIFPLFAAYHAAWTFQPSQWLPPAGLLLGIPPDQLVMLHSGLAAFSIVLLLLYLARLVPGKLAQLRELQLMVPARARSATMGLVELEGVLRIEPPADGKGQAGWFLEDDTGRIPVDPQRRGGAPLPICNDSLFFKSEELADGDYVYLLGHVQPNPDAPPGALDATRLVVRPVNESLLAGLVRSQPFKRPRTLRENPGVFVLAPGGERRAQTLLRRHLVTSAALSLATIATAVWLLTAELPRLHGYTAWSAVEIAAAPEPVLLQMIMTADSDIQRQAAAAFFARWREFGRRDPQRPDWVAPTLQLLRHSDPGTRQLAMQAVGTLRSAAEQVAPELHALLTSPQANVRAAAAAALGRLGAEPALNVVLLNGLLRDDPDPAVRDAACMALAGLAGGDRGFTSPCLDELLTRAAGTQRREAAQALALVTGDAERIVPLLAGILTDPDPQVRLAGAEGLRAHGPAASAAVSQIFAALQAEQDGDVEYRLLQACREIGPQAAPLVPWLLQEFHTLKPPHTRRDTILSVLRGIGPGATAALPDLLALLEDRSVPEDELRAALAILGEFGAQALGAVPAAQRLQENARDVETRQMAEWFLKRMAASQPRVGAMPVE